MLPLLRALLLSSARAAAVEPAALLPRLHELWSCSGEPNISCVLEKLYPDHAGFEGGGTAGDELTYGEITARGIQQFIDGVGGLSSSDGFVDLGSGVGKAVLQVFLSTPATRAVGVELAEDRHRHAARALRTVAGALGKPNAPDAPGPEATLRLDGRTLRFVQGNALEFSLEKSTVVFVSSLAMPAFVIRGLQDRVAAMAPGTLAVFASKLSGCHRGLLFLKKLNLEMTWLASSAMYLYAVTPPTKLGMDTKLESGMWGTSTSQMSRLRQVILDHGTTVWQHRLEGELGSSTACDAAELESIMKGEAAQAEAFLEKLDLAQHDRNGHSILHHLCDQHSSSVLAARQFGANQVFVKHQEAKQANLLRALRGLLAQKVLLDIKSCLDLASSADDAALLDLLRSHEDSAPTLDAPKAEL